jgi:hypothetical protein
MGHPVLRLQAGGCTNSDAAIAAFKRLLQAGAERKPIDLDDLAVARACARPVVEHARRQALEVCHHYFDQQCQKRYCFLLLQLLLLLLLLLLELFLS